MSPAGIAFTVIGSLCIGLPLLGGLSYFLFEKFTSRKPKREIKNKPDKSKRENGNEEIDENDINIVKLRKLLNLGYSEKEIYEIYEIMDGYYNEDTVYCNFCNDDIECKESNADDIEYFDESHDRPKALRVLYELIFNGGVKYDIERIKLCKNKYDENEITFYLQSKQPLENLNIIKKVFSLVGHDLDSKLNNYISKEDIIVILKDKLKEKYTAQMLNVFSGSYLENISNFTNSQKHAMIYNNPLTKKYALEEHVNIDYLCALSRALEHCELTDKQLTDEQVTKIIDSNLSSDDFNKVYHCIYWHRYINIDDIIQDNKAISKADMINRIVEERIKYDISTLN